MHVYFFECSGEDALKNLERLKEQLETLFFIHSTNLLKNTKQPDLYLLEVAASEEPHIALPENTRVWSFEEVRSKK